MPSDSVSPCSLATPPGKHAMEAAGEAIGQSTELGLAEDVCHLVSLSAGRAVTQPRPVTEAAGSVGRRCF